MNGTCMGGLDAVTFFESLSGTVPERDRDRYERAMNRIRYETAKGVGVKMRTNKAVFKWHHDTYACGHCGCGLGEAWFQYCPNCGTAILRNPYTEKIVKEFEDNHQMTIEELIAGGEHEQIA